MIKRDMSLKDKPAILGDFEGDNVEIFDQGSQKVHIN